MKLEICRCTEPLPISFQFMPLSLFSLPACFLFFPLPCHLPCVYLLVNYKNTNTFTLHPLPVWVINSLLTPPFSPSIHPRYGLVCIIHTIDQLFMEESIKIRFYSCFMSGYEDQKSLCTQMYMFLFLFLLLCMLLIFCFIDAVRNVGTFMKRKW